MGQAEGLSAVSEALTLVNRTGERFYEAELYRLKGELTLQQFKVQGSKFSLTDSRPLKPDPQGEAEACFLKAMEISRHHKPIAGIARVDQPRAFVAESRQATRST